ncbi:Superfamily II DNA or RNA helicase, SNF2 family [Peptoclostridium litorale DSM 5388]|uniref:Putative ATP-dependent helicase n=1 Tax=Peptoclostridium litorale DSM 5388 TaxID=1121324 RepID=A0A069RNX7_PEPLI|nr:DEAD/DEAH box helicase [Peptoclostridium litorale]KDR95882.1 putative ATP-dependent helicase [Peptoclostridium litorale DSM 5388]SIO10753.1 Superfamily II DNA or RNA helicase, SNF2 family [Peptoclostridium litorale DSM 5388]
MFGLTEKSIRSNAFSAAVYKRGLEYYKSGKVKDIYYNENTRSFAATVSGSEDYTTCVHIGFGGTWIDAECTCPAYDSWMGYSCKHIVALQLHLMDNPHAKKSFDTKMPLKSGTRNGQDAAHTLLEIFRNFDSQKMKKKKRLKLECHIDVDCNANEITFWMKIGEKKLYVVRDMASFLSSVASQKQAEFTRGFTYDPSEHEFEDQDSRIIDFLMQIYSDEQLLGKKNWKDAYLSGKHVSLSKHRLKSLLELIDSKTFNITYKDSLYPNIHILREDIPLDFTLMSSGKYFELLLKNASSLRPLTEDCSYVLFEGNLYNIPADKSQILSAVSNVFGSENADSIRIENSIVDEFVSLVSPALGSIGNVIFHESLSEKMEKNDLLAELYIDSIGGRLTADLKYKYGSHVIDPLKPPAEDTATKILVRDMHTENSIMNIIEEFSFKVSKDGYYLDNDNSAYEFLTYGVLQIQKHAQVYYSSSFRSNPVIDPESFSAELSLSSGQDYLSFEFSIEGLENEDLPLVLEALSEKRTFYKLKNGSFLPLETNALQQLSQIAKYTQLTKDQMESGVMNIPSYRAFFMDEQLKNMDIRNYNKSKSLNDMIFKIKNPECESIDPPASLASILRDYQKTGFEWLKTLSGCGFGGILADDMGLGKTLQVLSLLLSEKESSPGTKRPSLIVAPTSLLYNWISEAENFTPNLNVRIIDGNKAQREIQLDNLEGIDLLITSYSMVRNDIESYTDMDFKYCILDEAQHIKNPASKTARAVKLIKSKNRFALTGTPIENSLLELWSIFDFIMPGFLYSVSGFKEKFEKPMDSDSGGTTIEVLKKHISPFMIRRLKNDVLTELPEKIENKLSLDLSKEQKKVYMAYLSKIKNEIGSEISENGFGRSQMKILAGLTRLRQICCDPSVFLDGYSGGSGKLEVLDELLDELIEGGHRILLFSQFTSMLGRIEEMIVQKGVDYFYLDGSTKSQDRLKMASAFNSGEKSIFLISLKAGGTGLNLTGADTVIHFDPWWNPAVENQASDRAYRMGQKNVVHVIKLIAKGTIEEKIYGLQQKKREMIDSVIKPGETMLSKMSESEIMELFEI